MAKVRISINLYFKGVDPLSPLNLLYEVNNDFLDILEEANIQLKNQRFDPQNPNLLIFDVDIKGYSEDEWVMFKFLAYNPPTKANDFVSIKYKVTVEKIKDIDMKNIELKSIVYLNRKGKEGYAKVLDIDNLYYIQLLKNASLGLYEYLYVNREEVESLTKREVCGFCEGDVVIFKNDLNLKNEPTFGFHKIERINLGTEAFKPSIKFANLNQPLFFNSVAEFTNLMEVFQKIEDQFK